MCDVGDRGRRAHQGLDLVGDGGGVLACGVDQQCSEPSSTLDLLGRLRITPVPNSATEGLIRAEGSNPQRLMNRLLKSLRIPFGFLRRLSVGGGQYAEQSKM